MPEHERVGHKVEPDRPRGRPEGHGHGPGGWEPPGALRLRQGRRGGRVGPVVNDTEREPERTTYR